MPLLEAAANMTLQQAQAALRPDTTPARCLATQSIERDGAFVMPPPPTCPPPVAPIPPWRMPGAQSKAGSPTWQVGKGWKKGTAKGKETHKGKGCGARGAGCSQGKVGRTTGPSQAQKVERAPVPSRSPTVVSG